MVYLERTVITLSSTHLGNLGLPAHTLPYYFLSLLLQQSLLGFFTRKMAKGTPGILSEQVKK